MSYPESPPSAAPTLFELVDYRRRVAALYRDVRDEGVAPAERVEAFRRGRDALVRDHPQSPLTPEERRSSGGLSYYPYDPEFRVLVVPEAIAEGGSVEIALRDDGTFRMRRVARLRFALGGAERTLTLFWIEGYGGGLFLPFRDASNGQGSYGGGRYLLDTLKGADLGAVGSHLVLDFNFAYNPSCAYAPQWHCPLSPPENRLEVAVTAGERDYP